jgi:hypothetical protein
MGTRWIGSVPGCDFCGRAPGLVFYDAKTKNGYWASMCPDCYNAHGVGLGTGRGQMYILRDGQYEKEAG